jgi:two-component system, NarL family, invasion response regulator UvrY
MTATKKITIMLVDDHTLIRECWRALLATIENMEIVAECGDGRLAGELAKNVRPDIVLLDLNMKPMNGFEVLKIIRHLSPLSKIIGLSMRSEPVLAKKLLRSGAKGYLTKNSSRNEMIDAINKVNKGNIYICQEVQTLLSRQTSEGDNLTPYINCLSASELQLLSLWSVGDSSKEIAAKSGITVKTVEVHRHNILKKMKLKSTAALISYVHSHALEL